MAESQKTDLKLQKAESYVDGKPLVNPYEVYSGYIAGWDEALKMQTKVVLQTITALKAENNKQSESSSQTIESLKTQIAQLKEELRQERQNHNNGNNGNNGHGNGGK